MRKVLAIVGVVCSFVLTFCGIVAFMSIASCDDYEPSDAYDF